MDLQKLTDRVPETDAELRKRASEQGKTLEEVIAALVVKYRRARISELREAVDPPDGQ